MSGHSKWSTIKRKKGEIDAARSKVFQKLAMEIMVAAKTGDPNPDNNASLRMVVDKARAANMPKDRIQSAIDKASSSNGGANYENIRYEGYGNHGVAVMVDCLTDNKNRTAGEVRSKFTKFGGNLGTTNSVAYNFERKGIIVVANSYDEDTVMNLALDNDALDFITNDDSFEIDVAPENFINMNNALKNANITDILMNEVRYVPLNTVTLAEEDKEKVYNMIDALEDLDDVQEVYHNMEE